MIAGDPDALFGGVVITNFCITKIIAADLVHSRQADGVNRVLDGVVGPNFSDEAIEILARKTGKCRILTNPALQHLNENSLGQGPRLKSVRGGYLVQPNYTFVLDMKAEDMILASGSLLTDEQAQDLVLAWAIGSMSTSNTITIVKDRSLLGNGVGQQHRAAAAQLAVKRALDSGHNIEGAVAYSDSFFPFRDGLDFLANAGITAILASSGSVRDKEIAAAAAKHGITLLWVPDAVGRGFCH